MAFSSPAVTATLEASRDVARELYELFAELDRGRLQRERLASMRTRLDSVRGKIATISAGAESEPSRSHSDAADPRASAAELAPAPAPLGGELKTLDALLDRHAPTRDQRSDWIALRQQVQPTYERIVRALQREDIHVPSLRPTNYARNVLHLASATSALLALELAPSWTVAIGIAAAVAALGVSLEIGRRLDSRINDFCMSLFGRTAHPHEAHRVNSATWYAIAVLLMAICQQAVPSAIALVVLGVGDPIAAIVGRRYGRVRLVNGRSLEGSLAFVASGGLAAAGYVGLFHPEVGLAAALASAFAGALAGAVAELVSRRIDDNFSIPLTAFGAAFLALAAL